MRHEQTHDILLDWIRFRLGSTKAICHFFCATNKHHPTSAGTKTNDSVKNYRVCLNKRTMQVDWELSQTLESDGQGIRAIGVLPPKENNNNNNNTTTTSLRLLAGTQAGGLTEFCLSSGDLTVIPYQHNHAITALLTSSSFSSSSSLLSKSCLYVTGCKDALIRIFDGHTHECLATLSGHDKPVTSLAWGALTTANRVNRPTADDSDERYLISGSWDGTAKVWKITAVSLSSSSSSSSSSPRISYSLVATLAGHENSVSVASIVPWSKDANKDHILTIVTGSAGVAQNNQIRDHAVRVWQVDTHTGSVLQRYHVANDHDGPIRDVVALFNHSDDPNTSQKYNDTNGGAAAVMVASCSNDGTVKLRDPTGQAISTWTFVSTNTSPEHPPMLLSLCTVVDPSTTTSSSFSISSLIASAEDGHVVAWDFDAPSEESNELHASSSSSSSLSLSSSPQILRHPVCVWTVRGLPNGDFCTGSQDGKLRIFTKATERMASEAEREAWAEQVQQALQKQSSGPSAEEIAKLPLWENHLSVRGHSEGQVQLFQKSGIAIAAQWSAASATWIEVGQVMGSNNNDASSSSSGIIDGVQYDHVLPIEVDTAEQGVARLQIGYNNGENPFVAAQRFIDAHVLPQYHLAQIADYIQQRTQSASRTIGAESSGSGAAGGGPRGATTGVPIASYVHVPAKTYKVFDLSEKAAATTFDKMKTKVESFGKVTPDQMERVSRLMEILAATNQYHSTQMEDQDLAVISELLATLPPSEAFPALDLARMAVLHPDAASSERMNVWSDLMAQTLALCKDCSAAHGPAIPMLSLRLFANAFQGGPGSLQAISTPPTLDAVLSYTSSQLASSNKNIRLSVATVLYNVCYFVKAAESTAPLDEAVMIVLVEKLMTMVHSILTNKAYESEGVFRALVAAGTLLSSPSGLGQQARLQGNAIFLAAKVEPAASPHGAEVKAAAKEVYSLLV